MGGWLGGTACYRTIWSGRASGEGAATGVAINMGLNANTAPLLY